jgi:hypothetical protein
MLGTNGTAVLALAANGALLYIYFNEDNFFHVFGHNNHDSVRNTQIFIFFFFKFLYIIT